MGCKEAMELAVGGWMTGDTIDQHARAFAHVMTCQRCQPEFKADMQVVELLRAAARYGNLPGGR